MLPIRIEEFSLILWRSQLSMIRWWLQLEVCVLMNQVYIHQEFIELSCPASFTKLFRFSRYINQIIRLSTLMCDKDSFVFSRNFPHFPKWTSFSKLHGWSRVNNYICRHDASPAIESAIISLESCIRSLWTKANSFLIQCPRLCFFPWAKYSFFFHFSRYTNKLYSCSNLYRRPIYRYYPLWNNI